MAAIVVTNANHCSFKPASLLLEGMAGIFYESIKWLNWGIEQ